MGIPSVGNSGLNKRCYFCFREAVTIRHDTPRCPDHLPIVTLEPEKDNGPKTPRTPGLFGTYGEWLDQQGM